MLTRVEKILEPVMVFLGLLFLILIVLDFGDVPMTPRERDAVRRADDVIYWVFVADFLLRLLIAPDRMRWVRANWLLLASLLLPFLRPLRAMHVLGGLQEVPIGQIVFGLNRGLRSLEEVFRGRSALYLSLVTTLIVLVGSGATLLLERDTPGAELTTFGDALWWAATLVTTINSDFDPVSPGGRVVGWLIRVYAVGVFGYLTASIARFLVGRVRPAADDPSAAPAKSQDAASSPEAGIGV